ncbi:MAG: glycosyltransferase family 2 protein [Actinomycetota bacterium]|nr:glycosyltransferase family 2 protein [Actinomycetota bacterium]
MTHVQPSDVQPSVIRPGDVRPGDVRLSVVVPCRNEEAVLRRLHAVLTRDVGAITPYFEVLLVDDGSTDRTLERMREIHGADARFRYLALSRNFGKEAAMLAGLSQARGDAVAILDADLQHPPSLLAEMLPLLDAGYDQVVARRTRTGDRAARRLASRLYYRIFNRLIEVDLQDGAGDFRLLSSRAVRALLSLGEYNRFSKGLFSWIGFSTTTVDCPNVGRESGQSRWRFSDLVNYGIDGVISFNAKPLRLSIYFGAAVTGLAFLYAVWVVLDYLVRGNEVDGYVTLICAILGFGGVQLILLGVIGEYLGRIYYETKRRPHFLLKESSDPVEVPVTVALGPEHEQQVRPDLRPSDSER